MTENRWKSLFFLILLTFLLGLTPYAHSQQQKPGYADKVLILYDSSGQWGWVGELHSQFLANLIGHFNKKITRLPVEQYTAGTLHQFSTTFYLGTTYDNPLPQDFIKDALNTTQTLVWFRYNLWELIQGKPNFASKYGFTFDKLDISGYDRVIYKNITFVKNTRDAELGRVIVTNTSWVKVPATAERSSTKEAIPYIVHSGNMWYVADIPFTYLTENDRYLVFADLLYDMLEVESVGKKRAILRLEDIDPTYNTKLLKEIADYLYSQQVPFAIAVIPYYNDPLGYYTNGHPRYVKMTDVPDFIATLKYMQSKGGTIILHGYTHQHASIFNALTGVSGHDYEFFRVIQDAIFKDSFQFSPLSEDSYIWVKDKITSALTLLNNAGFTTSIWETPHYLASRISNEYFAEAFAAVIGRIPYFYKDNEAFYAEQFYPYVIQKDNYGQKVIPENLGCVSPIKWFNFPIHTVDDIITSAAKNLAVRDAWASMYYHPYLGLSYLQQLIPAIKALGYEFVPVSPNLN